jgi:curli production assembly/transport component CsgE
MTVAGLNAAGLFRKGLIVGFLALLTVALGIPSRADNDVEIDGLVIDQTRGKIAHDFVEYFRSLWEGPAGAEDYNIVIDGQTDPRTGTWVSVDVNDVVVYRELVKPREEDVESAAQAAVEAVRNFLLNREEYERSLQEEADMRGSGIH